LRSWALLTLEADQFTEAELSNIHLRGGKMVPLQMDDCDAAEIAAKTQALLKPDAEATTM
jgi:hypothetical protein